MKFGSAILDDDGTVNPAHLIAMVLAAASVLWVSYLVYTTRALPDLTGVAYLLGGSGLMNVAHKAEDIIAKFKKDPPQADPGTPSS